MRCEGEYTNGRKKGKRCGLLATNNTRFCGNHQKVYKAQIARDQGLRTIAKPGEPGYRGTGVTE